MRFERKKETVEMLKGIPRRKENKGQYTFETKYAYQFFCKNERK